jgi:IS30 family transposase
MNLEVEQFTSFLHNICCMSNSYKHLTSVQRHQIKVLYNAGHSLSFIGDQLGIHKSTVSRELKRNARQWGSYDPVVAQQIANDRKERFAHNRKFTPGIEKFIREKLQFQQWSPEQIKGYCDKHNIPMVSHQRIYQFILQDKENGGELYKNLRTGKKKRRRKYGKGKADNKAKNRISIDLRPSVVNNKERFGDWEIDTIVGKNNKGAILTVVERKSAFVLMVKLNGRNAEELAKSTVRLLAPYKDKVHTITSDNGSEFARHQQITKKLNAQFYFAHPYSSWERGLNEYTNKLIRQYIPKKLSFDNIDQKFINDINLKLNMRPRKNLMYDSPIKIYLSNFD